MAQRRVTIRWTESAERALRKLPKHAQRGLLEEADKLYECEDPCLASKPLVGPLHGYYRIRFSRYRAVYAVQEEELANGDTLVQVYVYFVVAGLRAAGDRKDVYRFAERLVKMGLLEPYTPSGPGGAGPPTS